MFVCKGIVTKMKLASTVALRSGTIKFNSDFAFDNRFKPLNEYWDSFKELNPDGPDLNNQKDDYEDM